MAHGYRRTEPPTRYDLGPADQPPPPPSAAPGPRPAPASVRVAALMLRLGGLATAAFGVLAGYAGVEGAGFGQGWPDGWVAYLTGVGLAGGAAYVFAGLILFAFGRKVRRGRRWARLLVLGVAALTVGGTLYTGLVGPGNANALFGLVFPVLYLVLLNTPAARSWYRDRTY